MHYDVDAAFEFLVSNKFNKFDALMSKISLYDITASRHDILSYKNITSFHLL